MEAFCCPMCAYRVFLSGEFDFIQTMSSALFESHLECHVEDFRIELGMMKI